ncbi:glycosyltransferase family 2 protein [Selenomonas ruminantium]|uniref:glycosyltransferase family 2 protein n=1 Tax=Selenomonas ruminantium TaxID=971 RepID=UPI000419B6DA|nr:glycosyltransferase family 2 protein [Selenomonas ruminantium]
MIYVCVLNYNNVEDTLACLDSLQKLTYIEYRILIVDNNSRDRSSEILQQYADEYPESVKFFSLNINRGYAAGNNMALRYAMSQGDMEYCWILNNDTLVDPNSLTWLVEYMKKHQDVGICGSKLIYSWDRTKIQGYGGKYNPWLSISDTIKEEECIDKIDFVIGASVFVRKSFLEDIGLMCEDYFLYFEELDWKKRAEGKYKISCEPRSIVYHKEGATIGVDKKSGSQRKSEIADYFEMRNRLLFTYRFYPYCLPTVYVVSLIKILNRLRRQQYRRAFSFVKLLFGIRDSKFESNI